MDSELFRQWKVLHTLSTMENRPHPVLCHCGVTTIVLCTGFGHMAPSTFSGRLFCIFYALLGIPLCIVTLKAVGERINQLLENLFILISSKSQLRQEKRTKVKVLIASAGSVLALLLLGGLLYYSEDWTYFEGVYYCFIGNSSFNQWNHCFVASWQPLLLPLLRT